MDLRHLRCFIVLAEELNFARAAARLHTEPSPLSRTISHLEGRIGVRLFNRSRRGTHLTPAGEVFLEHVRRMFVILDQALEDAKAVAAGQFGVLRVAVSDGITQPRLASLLALCREEEPATTIRLAEVPLNEQLRGLRNGDFDVGFARTNEVGDDFVCVPLWEEVLVVAIPLKHPLLAHPLIPIDQLLLFPLVAVHPDVCEGYNRGVERVLRSASGEPKIAVHATSLEMMLTLVAAGYGAGFATTTQIEAHSVREVITRPFAMENPVLTTYLLRKAQGETSGMLAAFVARVIRELGEDLPPQ